MKRVLASLAVSIFVCGAASAQTSPDDLKAVERRLEERTEAERRLQQEAEDKAREVASLRTRMIETANSIQDSERDITRLEDKIAQLDAERTAAISQLEAEGANVSSVLAALQSLALSQPPALIVSPEDANEAARAAMVLVDAAPELEAKANQLREVVSRLTELSEALGAERANRQGAIRDLAARRDVLSDLMDRKEKERDVARSLAAAAQKETARLAVQATSLREIVRRLERLAHVLAPRIKPNKARLLGRDANSPSPPTMKRTAPIAFAPSRAFASAKGLLRPPVAGPVTGVFGRTRPEGGRYQGMRFSARNEAIVTAPYEGKVVVARDWRPIGNLVILDVGGGYHILFLGVGAILVEENQRITAGEPVAQMAGASGILDLEIRKNGEPVDPSAWLSDRLIDVRVQ